MVSFLREQRACKVVLLFNVDALEEDRSEFDTLFEKVIDAQLGFAPTAEDATEIALTQQDTVTRLLQKNCIALGISNIRVIKKIQRLVLQITPLLTDFEPEITQQTTHSITLFGWTKFQPKIAPPYDFYRTSSIVRYVDQKNGKKLTPDETKWNDMLDRYEFSNMDDFDHALWAFVEAGVRDSPAIQKSAAEQNEKCKLMKKSNSLEAAWRPFHDFSIKISTR